MQLIRTLRPIYFCQESIYLPAILLGTNFRSWLKKEKKKLNCACGRVSIETLACIWTQLIGFGFLLSLNLYLRHSCIIHWDWNKYGGISLAARGDWSLFLNPHSFLFLITILKSNGMHKFRYTFETSKGVFPCGGTYDFDAASCVFKIKISKSSNN